MFPRTWVVFLMAWVMTSSCWEYDDNHLMKTQPELGPRCKAPLKIGFSTNENYDRLIHSINQFRNAYASGLTDRPNDRVKALFPPASSMRVVHRDAELSLIAQRIVNQCAHAAHSPESYNPPAVFKLEVERFKNRVDAWHFVWGSPSVQPEDIFFANGVSNTYNQGTWLPKGNVSIIAYENIIRAVTMGNIDPGNKSFGTDIYYTQSLLKMMQTLLDERIYVVGLGNVQEHPHKDYDPALHADFFCCVVAPRDPKTRRRSYTTGKGASRCPKGTEPSRKYTNLCDYPNRSSKSQLEIALITVWLIMWRWR